MPLSRERAKRSDQRGARAYQHSSFYTQSRIRADLSIGEWEVVASVGKQSLGRGRTVFAWLEGGAFLVQRSEVEQVENGPSFLLLS